MHSKNKITELEERVFKFALRIAESEETAVASQKKNAFTVALSPDLEETAF
jgi:hypothetical protein